jgi:uncharacterized membrane protein YeaQ/YmgE (transglycosylase-associated protein family)
MSIWSWFIYLLVAAICGGIGRAIAGGTRGGCLVSIAVGFIGALLGQWISMKVHLPEPMVIQVGGKSFPVLWSIVGAALFVAVIHLITGRRKG